MTAEFDAILFDAGGVLLCPSPEHFGPLVVPFGGSDDPEVLMAAHFRAAHALDHARADGVDADWDAYGQAYVRAAGVPEERAAEAAAAFAAHRDPSAWKFPVPGAAEVLAALAERGVPIGIVSNAVGQVQADLAELGICAVATPETDTSGAEVVGADVVGAGAARVVCVVDSHVVGVSKPDPAIFRLALEALGLPASPRIAYVGDTVFYDVRAATAAGLSPLLHDPYGYHRADPHPSGPHRNLDALKDLLDHV